MNVAGLLHQAAAKFPDHIAIYDDHGSLTYSELGLKVKRVSAEFQKSGFERGTGVAVMGGNSCDFIILSFAVMESGAVLMPLSPGLTDDELNEFIRIASPHYILSEDNRLDGVRVLPDEADGVLQQQWSLYKNDSVNHEHICAPHVADAALIRFTSGTTGVSKGVVLSHQTIEARTAAANEALKLNENDRIMWVLSMAFHFVVSIILYIRNGCSIIIGNEMLASGLLQKINVHHATFLYVSPMHIRLLASDTSGLMMPSVRKVISTSTAISRDQCMAFRSRYNLPVIQAYGIIELGLPAVNSEMAAIHPDAIGYPSPGFEIEILDDEGQVLPAGETGNLAMRGPGIFDAYLNPPVLSDRVLNHGWFMTGDLAVKSPDGLITVAGRRKSMINVAGNKVFPEDVEAVLDRHPGVKICRVRGFSHPILGESVLAEVVPLAGVKPDPEELIRFCRKSLSSYKVPQKIIFVESLPMTPSGKVSRSD